MKRLSLLENLALASATATQRARALKKLIDEEIDARDFTYPEDEDCVRWPIERWVRYFLDGIYAPQSDGEHVWLLRTLIRAYTVDPSRRKLLRHRMKTLADARANAGVHSHAFSSHTHSIGNGVLHNHTINYGPGPSISWGPQNYTHSHWTSGVTYSARSGTITR